MISCPYPLKYKRRKTACQEYCDAVPKNCVTEQLNPFFGHSDKEFYTRNEAHLLFYEVIVIAVSCPLVIFVFTKVAEACLLPRQRKKTKNFKKHVVIIE
jgi:hypothetical protein